MSEIAAFGDSIGTGILNSNSIVTDDFTDRCTCCADVTLDFDGVGCTQADVVQNREHAGWPTVQAQLYGTTAQKN